VLETAGVRHWALERVPPGAWRNISNGLSIRSNIHAHSEGLRELCFARGWWDGTVDLDWKLCLCAGGSPNVSLAVSGRERAGSAHLSRLAWDSANGGLPALDHQAWVRAMTGVLRDERSGICLRDPVASFCSTGSQISWLPPHGTDATTGGAHHFFSGASDPVRTAYKRFSFGPSASRDETDHGTRDLWAAWRELALKQLVPSDKLAATVAGIEEAALASMGQQERGSSGVSFASAVALELKAVRANTPATAKPRDGG